MSNQNQEDFSKLEAKSNFFSGIEENKDNIENNIVNYENNENNNKDHVFIPENNSNANNYYDQNNQINEEQSFFDKVNSTASDVFNFFKEKTSNVSDLTKNFFNKDAPVVSIENINISYFDKILESNSKEVPCQKLEQNKLSGLTVMVTISNPREVSSSLFKSAYTIYDVSTPQFGWTVPRRYSDFVWLRECLQNLFPGVPIPVIPRKILGGKRFEENVVKKRARGLQNFLNEIMIDENFKSAEPLLIFLSCIDRNFFESQMKMLSPKILVHTTVPSMRTFEGNVKIATISPSTIQEMSNYFSSIYSLSKKKAILLKRAHIGLKNFRINMYSALLGLEEAQKNLKLLGELYDTNKVKDNNNDNKDNSNDIDDIYKESFKKISSIFLHTSEFVNKWKKICEKQIIVFDDNMTEFIRGEMRKNRELMEIQEKEEDLRSSYTDLSSKLSQKKEALWQRMDTSKWDLNKLENIDMDKLYKNKEYAFSKMCFKDTYELSQIESMLGFYMVNEHNNVKKYLKESEISSFKGISDFSEKMQSTLMESINFWSTLASKLDDLNKLNKK